MQSLELVNVTNTVTTQQEGPGFKSTAGLCLCGVHVFSPCMHGRPAGFLASSLSSKTIERIRSTSDSKVPKVVSVSMSDHYELNW